jgi:hypothetical protein
MLKSFQSYMYEAKKVYEFRIKICQHDMINKQATDRLRSALEAYQLETISAVKRLPIQEHRDFPKMGPCECYVIDVGLNYPTIAAQVRQLVAERAGINAECVCVYPLNQDVYNEEFEAHGKDHEGAVLTDSELKDAPGAQELAGQVRVGSLLKELESLKFEYAATEKSAGVQGSDKIGTTSPVGTNKNKLPPMVKGK